MMGGGGGGGYYGSVSNADIQREIATTTGKLAEEYEAELQLTLDDLLSDINDRDIEATNSLRSRVREAIEQELDQPLINLSFGGSVQKNTYVNGISDIDALAVFRHLKTAEMGPLEVKTRIANAISGRLTDAEVTVGPVAVTVRLAGDVEFQVVPALRDGAALRVPSWKGESWSKINTRKFTKALTRNNEALSGKLIPTIKLAKRVIGELPERRQLSGYHIESLAINVFRGYNGKHSTSQMLPAFFREASKLVGAPIKDTTGQSLHVDEYLGRKNSPERRAVSHLFNRLAKRMSNASASQSRSRWDAILGYADE